MKRARPGLLAPLGPALLAVLMLSSTGIAAPAGTEWDCRQTADGGWKCTAAEPSPLREAPAPSTGSQTRKPAPGTRVEPPPPAPTAEPPAPPSAPEAAEAPPEAEPAQETVESPVQPEPTPSPPPAVKEEPVAVETPSPAPEEAPEAPPPTERQQPATAAPETPARPVEAGERRPTEEPQPTAVPGTARPAAAPPEPVTTPGPEKAPAAREPARDEAVQDQPAPPPVSEEKPAAAEEPAPTQADAAPQPPPHAAESHLHPNAAWELCGPVERPAPLEVKAADEDAPIHLSADEAKITRDRLSRFWGNVEVQQGNRLLTADEVLYNEPDQRIQARGNVRFRDDGLTLEGSEAQLLLEPDQGTFDDARFSLYERHARGTAKRIERDGPEIARLEDVTYTTCNPGNEDWRLNADKIKLDRASGVGTARNVSVRFKKVPIFYSPFMTFPLDDRRKSGFLTPSFGNSNESGAEFGLPYYWNIAPNRDATVTPRILEKRGVQLNGEYRYLQRSGEGQVNLEYLPDDSEFQDDRILFGYQHHGRYARHWVTDVDYTYVSDDNYLEDLGTELSVSSLTHLRQQLTVRYAGTFWSATGRLQSFQTVDETLTARQRPYQRLPQLLVRGSLPNRALGLTYAFRGELVQFERDDSVTGVRLDLQPSISKTWRTSASFVTPKLTLQHSRYSLDNHAPGTDATPTRTVPLFSVDSGLFFERDVAWAGRSFLHTLEPRAFYRYAPFRDQDRLIVDETGRDVVFDTGQYTFSFAQLFREDRFSGVDRVGDANQLTLALTSRLLDPAAGRERLKASIGQIFFFEDRDVTLPNRQPEETSTSDVVAELSAQISHAWSTTAGLHWDTEEEQTSKGIFQLQYQPDDKRVVNLAYRFRRDFLEQTDVSLAWPVTRHLTPVVLCDYALDSASTLEAFGGLEYETCCWVVRFVGRRFLNDTDGEFNNSVLLQLELKGLTSFGDKVTKFLERGILGYGQDPY